MRTSTQFLKMKVNFPPNYKFRKLCLEKRGPIPIIKHIKSAKNVGELKELFSKISKRDRKRICKKTQLQSSEPLWHLFRQACITGTLIKRVVNAILQEKPSDSINRAISKFSTRRFTNEAMEYGIKHEKDGVEVLWNYFKKRHRNTKFEKIGICMHEELPFLVGSPDVLLICENCCNPGKKLFIGEVKCPYRLRDVGIDALDLLEYLNEDKTLKTSHTYYFQQNLYCGLNNASMCYFIIWTPKGHHILEIEFDPNLYKTTTYASEKYYFENYVTQFYK